VSKSSFDEIKIQRKINKKPSTKLIFQCLVSGVDFDDWKFTQLSYLIPQKNH